MSSGPRGVSSQAVTEMFRMTPFRKLPVKERVAWLNSKTDNEVVELYNQHKNCMERKLAQG